MMLKRHTSYFLILFSFVILFSTFYSLERVWADSVIATIPVGNEPFGIAYNPDDREMYVTNTNNGTVSVINTSNHQVIATIHVGNTPYGITYASDNREMYISNFSDNTTSVINASDHRVVATIPVGKQPFATTYDPDNGKVYVTNYYDNTVSVIDTSNHQVVGTIQVGYSPSGIAYNPNNDNMYVVNENSNSISVIDTTHNTVIDTINVEPTPRAIAYNPNNHNVYVTNTNYNSVSVIDPSNNAVVSTINVGQNPEGIAYNPDNHDMYVTNSNSNSVSVIDPSNNAVVSTINVGNEPYGIAYNNDYHDMYVTNVIDNSVSVVSISPIANAGSNQHTQPFQTVHLNGSASFDPTGSALAYHWTQTSGPTVLLSGSDSATPSFVAPNVNVRTTITFELVVRNSDGILSSPSGVAITISQPVPPIADVGHNQEVQPHQTVHLNGSASFDPSGFTPLTYNWTQTSGPTVSLSDPYSATPSFVAPNVNEDTVLSFQLIVTNSNGIPSLPSSVDIEVLVLSSSHPSPQQNNGTTQTSNVDSYNNNGHNTHLNYQSQNSYNLQSPMCLTVFGSCDTIGGQSQNMDNEPDR